MKTVTAPPKKKSTPLVPKPKPARQPKPGFGKWGS